MEIHERNYRGRQRYRKIWWGKNLEPSGRPLKLTTTKTRTAEQLAFNKPVKQPGISELSKGSTIMPHALVVDVVDQCDTSKPLHGSELPLQNRCVPIALTLS